MAVNESNLNTDTAPLADLKICAKCTKALPRTSFYNSRGSVDGLLGTCITCKKAISRVSQTKQRELRKRIKLASAEMAAKYGVGPEPVATDPLPKGNIEKWERKEKEILAHLAKGTMEFDRLAGCVHLDDDTLMDHLLELEDEGVVEHEYDANEDRVYKLKPAEVQPRKWWEREPE